MAKIVFSPEAANDLQNTKEYIAVELDNPQASAKTVANIIRKIRVLSDFPESGALLSSIVSFESDYRFLVCGNYTVFYRTDSENVHIVRVLYGRRNFMQILFGKTFDEPEET